MKEETAAATGVEEAVTAQQDINQMECEAKEHRQEGISTYHQVLALVHLQHSFG